MAAPSTGGYRPRLRTETNGLRTVRAVSSRTLEEDMLPSCKALRVSITEPSGQRSSLFDTSQGACKVAEGKARALQSKHGQRRCNTWRIKWRVRGAATAAPKQHSRAKQKRRGKAQMMGGPRTAEAASVKARAARVAQLAPAVGELLDRLEALRGDGRLNGTRPGHSVYLVPFFLAEPCTLERGSRLVAGLDSWAGS